MSIKNATTNKQLTAVTVTVPQTPGTKGSKAGKHVLSALSCGQLFSITLTKRTQAKSAISTLPVNGTAAVCNVITGDSSSCQQQALTLRQD